MAVKKTQRRKTYRRKTQRRKTYRKKRINTKRNKVRREQRTYKKKKIMRGGMRKGTAVRTSAAGTKGPYVASVLGHPMRRTPNSRAARTMASQNPTNSYDGRGPGYINYGQKTISEVDNLRRREAADLVLQAQAAAAEAAANREAESARILENSKIVGSKMRVKHAATSQFSETPAQRRERREALKNSRIKKKEEREGSTGCCGVVTRRTKVEQDRAEAAKQKFAGRVTDVRTKDEVINAFKTHTK
tara:strand:- start:1797 stop:2534 length:738 start_codon:yes stop_codon:yes gene_type:complete